MSFSSFQAADFLPILPEITLVVVAVIVMVLDILWPTSRRRSLGIITAVGFVVTIVLTLIFSQPGGGRELIWGGMLRNDLVAFIFRLIFMFAGAITALLSLDVDYVGRRGEYYALLVGAVIGMNFVAFSADLIMIFLAIETTSLAAYILAGIRLNDNKSAEAGMKYFLYGAATSAVMLFGFSLLYGFTGETNLYVIAESLGAGETPLIGVAIAALLAVVGIGFKVAAVPFHFWTPDVYEGAPTPITSFVSTASKSAGFALLFRVLLAGFLTTATDTWLPLLIAMAAVTMTLGNLVALAQKNIKRLLAYSSIAHAGYALVAVVSFSELGTAATLFYLMTYVLTNLAAFGVVIIFSRTAGSDEIADYAGLSRRSPYLSLAMLIAFLSLAGMPPLAGFFGKFYVFAAAIDAGLVWLAIVGVLNAIIGLYYYLVVLKVVYVTPMPEGVGAISVPQAYQVALVILIFGIILLGTLSGPWFNWALQAAEGLF